MPSIQEIVELDRRYGIAGIAKVVAGGGGMPKVVVSTAKASGEMYLHGGQVTSWEPVGQRGVIYCSPNAHWNDGIAIRGGVPVCFPWFGDKADNPSAPAHGFVRTKTWVLVSVEQAADGIAVTMATESDADTRKWWPFDFRVLCRAVFGGALKLELIVTNAGNTAFDFEEALHAYFAVGDVEQVSLHSADAIHFIDKTDNFSEQRQSGDIRFKAETDRIYFPATEDVEIEDVSWDRRVTLHKQNSMTTVVWNPWVHKSASIADLGPGQWKNFVCVETSNVGVAAVSLDPGETHTMTAHIQLDKR